MLTSFNFAKCYIDDIVISTNSMHYKKSCHMQPIILQLDVTNYQL
jgi:hypothetical protein